MLSIIAMLAIGAPLKDPLFFVRHGETIANATGKYSSATIDTFSSKGETEVKALTETLIHRTPFEIILVSPSPRVLNTIAPYLQRTKQRAIIWPLLYECCTGKRPAGVKPTKFTYGAKIVVPKKYQLQFLLMRDEYRFPVASTYAQGLAQVKTAVEEYKKQFKDEQVLMVGHSGMGGQFIHQLTGKWIKIDNAKLFKVPIP